MSKEIERVIDSHAKRIMTEWDFEKFKKTHPKLLEVIIEVSKELAEITWDVAHQAGRFEGKGIAEKDWQTFEQHCKDMFN